MKLGYAILYTAYSVVLSVVLLLALNPRQYEAPIMEAVTSEYSKLYCGRDKAQEVAMQIGGAAALSRIIVSADLGTWAQAVYLNCRPPVTKPEQPFHHHVTKY